MTKPDLSDHGRVASAILRLVAEHGAPNRTTFAELHAHHGAPIPMRGGKAFSFYSKTIADWLAPHGIEAHRDRKGIAITYLPTA